MTDQDVNLVQKAGKRLSLVVRRVAIECETTNCRPCEKVLDDALQSINHKGLHAHWNLVRAMVGVDPVD